MVRARIAALVALLAVPSAMGVQAVVRADAEGGPTATVTVDSTGQVAIVTARVEPTTVSPGEPVTITVDVGPASMRQVLVRLALYDPVGDRVFERLWDGKVAGGADDLHSQFDWRVPGNALTGHWTVEATVFDSGWDRLMRWNEPAARIFDPGQPKLPAEDDAVARLTVRSPALPTPTRTPTAARPRPGSTGGRTAPVRFGTLPPGAVLPSGGRCAVWVRALALPERKGMNRAANLATGHRLGAGFFDPRATDPRAARLAGRVDGAFTGTTEQILRWAACKWGIDEDLVRAQAAAESWWRQTTKGDWAGDGTACPPGHRLGADGRPGECPQSYGILQNRYPYERSAWPGIDQSTAMNADTAYAVWRACFEGYEPWLNDVEHGRPYRAGDAWGCAGRWFSGRWHTELAEDYISKVRGYLRQRVWERPDFTEP
jgi:hypothetical protein